MCVLCSVPHTIITDAKRKEVPVVSSDWIIETLINGQQVNKGQFLI